MRDNSVFFLSYFLFLERRVLLIGFGFRVRGGLLLGEVLRRRRRGWLGGWKCEIKYNLLFFHLFNNRLRCLVKYTVVQLQSAKHSLASSQLQRSLILVKSPRLTTIQKPQLLIHLSRIHLP